MSFAGISRNVSSWPLQTVRRMAARDPLSPLVNLFASTDNSHAPKWDIHMYMDGSVEGHQLQPRAVIFQRSSGSAPLSPAELRCRTPCIGEVGSLSSSSRYGGCGRARWQNSEAKLPIDSGKLCDIGPQRGPPFVMRRLVQGAVSEWSSSPRSGGRGVLAIDRYQLAKVEGVFSARG